MTLADIDTDRTGLRLVGTLPYATTTMFRGVFMLTERASLCISRTGAVETKYPLRHRTSSRPRLWMRPMLQPQHAV